MVTGGLEEDVTSGLGGWIQGLLDDMDDLTPLSRGLCSMLHIHMIHICANSKCPSVSTQR